MPSRDLSRLMWAEACELLDRAERLHRQFYRPSRSASLPNWEPPVDLYHYPGGLWLIVALPGADGDSIEVYTETEALLVRAERPLPTAAAGASMQRLEIPFGHFERRVPLPPGQYRMARREWRDGCLYLDLRSS